MTQVPRAQGSQAPAATPHPSSPDWLQAAAPKADGREVFSPEELTVVMSNWDVGVIRAIKEFPRGSRKAPKLLIDTDTGRFLLKRRARGRDDPFKVAFTHSLQLQLAAKQFPLPHLIGTKRDNNSMLQKYDAVYELFEYIAGQGYSQTLESTQDSGRVLALYHKLLEDFETEYDAPTGSYHAAPSVEKGLERIPSLMPDKGMAETCAFLTSAYLTAVQKLQAIGIDDWPPQIVHGDWHPGNMLFRDDHVVGVIDYDSARRLPRVIDTANGVLQFSILGGDENLDRWPDYLDESRFKRFLRGYDRVVLLSKLELQASPLLMIEALIAEAVYPIAATGSFGRLPGGPFLNMVCRKVRWLQGNADRLVKLIED